MSTLDNYENPASASLSEMGGTMETLAYTMDLLPNDRDYEYGKTYAFAALTILPNIFGTARHPSVERGTASDWLVRTVSYNTASQGGGLGYSLLAEAYLNFGWAGPPLVMILLGFGFAAAECFAARSASPGGTSLMGVILFFGLIYARAESTDIVRSIVWCGFLPLAVLTLFVAQKHLWRRPSLSLRRRAPERPDMA
jgi:oligosaccharide repeat unit polymerase